MSGLVEDAIFSILGRLGPGKSACPTDVARVLDPEDFRRALPKVRAAAVGLARQGRLVITRKGRPVDPDSFKGVWRLKAPE